MPTYKLTYFGLPGLGENIRATFALAGIPFEDECLTFEMWGAKKAEPKFADTQLPVLEVTEEDGTSRMMSQSRAILRYIGRVGKFNGKPLYPDDPEAQYLCDEVIETVEDFRPQIYPTFAIADQAEKEAARKALCTGPDGKIFQGLMKLDKRLGAHTFAAGPDPTIADAYAITCCYWFQAPSFLDGVPADTIDQFKNITALKNRLMALPPLQAYYAGADGLRTHYKAA